MEACHVGAKWVSFGILGGIIAPHVEGMSAVYAVSLEMLGEMQRENQMRVAAK